MVGLSSLLAAVVGVTAWLLLRTPTYHAPLGGPPSAGVDEPAAAALLRDLQEAVRRDAPRSAARLGASPAARADLAGVVRNARAAHVTGFGLRYVDADGTASRAGAFDADVQTRWRFAGFDATPAHLEVRLRFTEHAGRLRIVRIGGDGRRSPLWLSGSLQVRRTPDTLMLVHGTAAEADRMAALARTAVAQVRAVLTRWSGGVVVEVPHSQIELVRELHARPHQYDGIAAVTTTVDGSSSRTAPVHVFVNPQVFIPLTRQGAQVVLTHETTHVATGAATSPSPTWLAEGFADFVALRAEQVPLATAASRIAALVHHGHLPARLPDQQQFVAGSPHLEARYESAWLACRLLARIGGTRALVHFYRAVDAGRPVDTELRRWFGLRPPELTRRWRSVLSHLPA